MTFTHFTLDQDRQVPLRRPAISFNQGAEWKALISRYIGTIPPRCNALRVEHSVSSGPAPKCVNNAMWQGRFLVIVSTW